MADKSQKGEKKSRKKPGVFKKNKRLLQLRKKGHVSAESFASQVERAKNEGPAQ